MQGTMKYHLFGVTSLVLTLAIPAYPTLAQLAAEVSTSHPGATGAASIPAAGTPRSNAKPAQPLQVLTDAYEQAKG